MTDLNELERLARASVNARGTQEWEAANEALVGCVDEVTILAVINRLRKAEAESERLRTDAEKWRKFFTPEKPEPVRRPDGGIEEFMVRDVEGKPFRCACGCNVLHKPDSRDLELYQCNACGDHYSARAQEQSHER